MNRSAKFWSTVHQMAFLTFAIVIALVCVKMLAVGLSLLRLPFL